MDYSSEISVFSAIILGLLTAINPCHLAVNVIVEGYFTNESTSRRSILAKSALYISVRVITYILMAYAAIEVLRQGLNIDAVSNFLGNYGELILGPILIIFGIIILISERAILRNDPHIHSHAQKERKGVSGIIILAILTTVAFCPENALLYFGILIPLSVSADNTFIYPVFYAVAAMTPTAVIAFLFERISEYRENIMKIQRITTIIVAAAFILTGLYLTIENTLS